MNDLNLCMLLCVFLHYMFCLLCVFFFSFLCICSTLASFLLLVSMFSRGEIGVGAVGVRLGRLRKSSRPLRCLLVDDGGSGATGGGKTPNNAFVIGSNLSEGAIAR